MAKTNRCAPPELRLSGRATASVTAVPEAWNLSYHQAEVVTAHAALNTPPPRPNVADSDAADFSNTITTGAKVRDCVAFDAQFELAFEIVGGCPPYQASLATAGVIRSLHPCLPRQGAVLLSLSQIFTGDTFPNRAKGTLVATLSAEDCAGHTHSCTFEIPEP